MTQDRWKDIKATIQDKFSDIQISQEAIPEGGYEENIQFVSPVGKVLVEFRWHPVVLDKKTTYSRRIGSEVNVQYVYSEDEFVGSMKAYRYQDSTDEWEEIKSDAFFS